MCSSDLVPLDPPLSRATQKPTRRPTMKASLSLRGRVSGVKRERGRGAREHEAGRAKRGKIGPPRALAFEFLLPVFL